MVSALLSGIVLVAVLSAVLMINRSGYLLNNYIEMEREARNALETFAIDVRITQRVEWIRKPGGTELIGITLFDPDNNSVTYKYQDGKLKRGDRTLVSGIQSLSFTAYKYSDGPGPAAIDPAVVTNDNLLKNDTKMVQISLCAVRSRSTLADATNNVVSARYVLRNKPF